MLDIEKVEVWKDIPGWEGFYQVSNKGRVRSVTRYLDVFWCGFWRVKRYKGRKITGSKLKNGYRSFTLTKNSEFSYFNAHTLVLLAFRGPRPEGLEIRHLDGNKDNYALDNLVYGTPKENAQDRRIHGQEGGVEGEDCPHAKLTESKVRKIRKLTGKLSQRELGRIFGVSHTQIGAIQKGIWWKHVK